MSKNAGFKEKSGSLNREKVNKVEIETKSNRNFFKVCYSKDNLLSGHVAYGCKLSKASSSLYCVYKERGDVSLKSPLVLILVLRKKACNVKVSRNVQICYFVLRFNWLKVCGDVESNPGPGPGLGSGSRTSSRTQPGSGEVSCETTRLTKPALQEGL